MFYNYEITKEFHFSASHQLDYLPEGHQCKRLHGHNYIVKVTLGSDELNNDGFDTDFGLLEPIKVFIDENLDHRHLNEVFDFKTTSENLAKFFYDKIKNELNMHNVVEVAVSEAPKPSARNRQFRQRENKQQSS